MNPGDRVIYWAGLGGFNRVHATVIRPDTQFNPFGYQDTEGFWVRPDGWDHDYFVATKHLEYETTRRNNEQPEGQ